MHPPLVAPSMAAQREQALILPSNRRGERLVEAVAVADCCGREQQALYYYSRIQVVDIVMI